MDFLEHFDKFLDTVEQSQLGKDENHCYDLWIIHSYNQLKQLWKSFIRP